MMKTILLIASVFSFVSLSQADFSTEQVICTSKGGMVIKKLVKNLETQTIELRYIRRGPFIKTYVCHQVKSMVYSCTNGNRTLIVEPYSRVEKKRAVCRITRRD